ncbi:TonB-dependent siderophore receptor [Pelagicoccus enzymogenes]|uniref:TonB-dependent siderophore receptor n=1 Tax=Pelagicoccus enzymogenes TaxID=2773457 RepID=UPI0028102A89|nr:TonB-dependent siderophore receptor [Pelagicoccus enzymogenes]MDQ8196540.1 TonB-dependent siderophore receptor [Pelagicoccus enzymogenes]
MNYLKTLLAGSALGLAATASAQNSVDAPITGDQAFELSGFTVFGDHYDTIGAATRLPLSDRETPQTISLIDSSRLEAESMYNMDDVMRNVTGVNVSMYDTQRPLYFSRGFQITDFQVDGIPTYSGDTNQEFDTALYQRVEILRGANGLFSGSGKPSGTVNLHRKQAGKTFAASVTQTVGSWDYFRTQVDVNTPITADGKFRSRFVAALTDRDSFRDRYHEDKLAYLATFSADLAQNSTLTFGFQRQDNEPTASVWGTIPPLAADGTPSELPHTTNFATDWAYWHRHSSTAFVNLEHQLNNRWQLKAALNHTTGDEESLSTYANAYAETWLNKEDGSGVIITGYSWDSSDERNSIDLYLNGKFDLFEREHDIVFGTSHAEYESVALNTASGFAGTPWNYAIDNFYTWDGSAEPAMELAYLPGQGVVRTKQTGIYSSTRLRLTDAFSAVLGGRITKWDTIDYGRDDAGATAFVNSQYEIDNEFTPYVGFTYDLNQNLTFYGSYTTIFEPQDSVDASGNILGPVEGNNYEIGFKSSFAEGRATFTAALFQTEQDNFAVADPLNPDPLESGKFPSIGVDGTKAEGLELQLSGKVTDDWSMIFGYTHNNTNRHAGDPIWTNLPEDLVQLSTHYQFPGEWSRLAIGGGATWQSEIIGSQFIPGQGNVEISQGAYTLVNLHVNYAINERFSATLSAKNALDEIYLANLDYPQFGEPQNFLLSFKWKY